MRRLVVFAGVCLAVSAGYAAETHVFTAAQRNFWSLRPVTKPAVPVVKNKTWVKTPIDAFVLAKLEAAQIQPNPPADKLTLLKRVTIDVTGLPPTQEEIQAFLADKSPNAYEKVVDRLLASPAYGEAWGRHWLDVARYSDSNGFKGDETRPYIYKYRDWVIKSFNDDMPYDKFVRMQIAGDELMPGDPDGLIAMGFNRHFIQYGGSAKVEDIQQPHDDMTATTAVTFLGLNYGCARCHDHKFDPILQKDYYRLQAFFANTAWTDGPLPIKDPVERKKYSEQMALWDAKTKDIRAEILKIIEPVQAQKLKVAAVILEDESKEALDTDPAKRTPWQAMLVHIAQREALDVGDPFNLNARNLRGLKGDGPKRYEELQKQLASFDSIKPAPLPEGQFVTDISATAPPTHVLKGGDFGSPGEEVQPGFLSILDPTDPKITPTPDGKSTGRRSVLAAWLTDPKNPLPARVMVNRIWHYNFGQGIVATPGDFGMMGSRPTHPELLDYLASSFVENGWSVKKINRMILLSNTYQESSADQEKGLAADPDGNLLWKYRRRRMEAESIRDTMLLTSGLLNRKMGGPGVFPPIPDGTVSELSATAAAGAWLADKDPADSNRRSVYIFVRRNLIYPMLQEFDAPNTFESCDFRRPTVTPSQALDFLNNPLIMNWAQSFAGRILNDAGLSQTAQVDRAVRLAYGRAATPEEEKVLSEFIEKDVAILKPRFANSPDGKIDVRPLTAENAGMLKRYATKDDVRTKADVPLPTVMPKGMDPVRGAAFVDLAEMLLEANELLYIN